MAKPIGPICNLKCDYCFYLEKENLYPDERRWRMPDNVLDAFIRQQIEAHDVPEVVFTWQGGEPTLLGIDFFRRVIELQALYANGKRIQNSLQTNGTLLDDAWCAFLAEHEFLVGLSLDGPRDLHDQHRPDRHGVGSFDAVMRGLQLLKKHGVEFNTLTVVGRENSRQPLEVYRFLKEAGSRFLQFIPLVERLPSAMSRAAGLTLAEPPVNDSSTEEPLPVTPWSVEPAEYGRFLCAIFDEWVRHDVGLTYIQMFDVMLGIWSGLGAGLCVFAERCGSALALEHNGDLYSCDHYVYPQYRLGNILNTPMRKLAGDPRQRHFGNAKADTLPAWCRNCDVRFACNGECPKHRFLTTPDGEPGLNYLCAGYKMFFRHIDPYMQIMADLLAHQQPPALIMNLLREREMTPREPS
jgi:uncharacterized protein